MNSKKYYKGHRCEMHAFIPKDTSVILEVGCGFGVFGKTIKELHQIDEYWGIDIDDKSIQASAKVLDKVIKHDFNKESELLPEKYFDCIIFNDALEHLYNPWDVLKYCKKLLKNNGYIVCSIPNVRHISNLLNLIFKKDWKYVDAGTLDKTHYRFFTEKSIEQLFTNLDFNIISIKGINKKSSNKLKMYLFISFINLLSLLFHKKSYTKISKFHMDIKYLQFAVIAQINNKS